MKKSLLFLFSVLVCFFFVCPCYANQSPDEEYIQTPDSTVVSYQCDLEADPFSSTIESAETTNQPRDYARHNTYYQNIYYNDKIICTYTINLSYSYTDSRVVISDFTCTRDKIKGGFTISASTSKVNGNPAKATFKYTIRNSATGETSTCTTVYKCKTNGDVNISMK